MTIVGVVLDFLKREVFALKIFKSRKEKARLVVALSGGG